MIISNIIKRVELCGINADHPQLGMLYALQELFGTENVLNFDFLAYARGGGNDHTNRQFIEQTLAFKPDFIFFQAQDTQVLTPTSMGIIRANLPYIVIVTWNGDCRVNGPSGYLSSICQCTDATFISNVGQTQLFKNAGAPEVHYMQIAVDLPEDLGPGDWTPPFRVPDVVFLGNYYGNSFPGTADRERAIAALQRGGVDVGVVGYTWPQPPYPAIGNCQLKQQPYVYRRAKVVLSINHFNNIELYYSDRQLVSMLSGTAVVCRYVPGLEREFTDGVHCLFYHTDDELVSDVKLLLADENLRKRIGQAGREEILKNHTWHSRYRNALPIIERLALTKRARG